MTTLRTTIMVGVAALVLAVAAGCTGGSDDQAAPTIRQTTEGLIRGDVASRAGLGELIPTCPDLADIRVGVAWQCTAVTADQRTVAIDAFINEDGRIELATTNLIAPEALPSFERAAVDALNTTIGSSLSADDIDCGDLPVLFAVPDQRVMVCALHDPHTEETYDVTLTVTDIEGRQFNLVVADQPRGG